GATKVGIERSNARQLETCQKQIALTQSQIEQAAATRDQLNRAVAGGGSLEARLESAEKELERLEALLPLEAKRQAAEQSSQATEDKAELAKRRYRKARRRWRAALAAAGLPDELNPDQLKAMA